MRNAVRQILSPFVQFNVTCWWAGGLRAPPGYLRPSASSSPCGADVRAQNVPYTANLLSYGYNYSNFGNDVPGGGATMRIKQSSVVHPSEAILAADSLEGRDLFRAAVDSLWGCVICPWDYASSYNPSGPAYPIAAQHGTRANILMADGGVRLYRPGPVRMPSGSDVNSQFRSGPKATGNYWWDSDELSRSRRDGLYTD